MVAIKEMEMPKSCTECEITYENKQRCDICGITYSNVTYEVRNNLKASDCPLVEVDDRKIKKLEKIEEIVNCELIAGRHNYKSCYNAFYEIVDVIQERNSTNG